MNRSLILLIIILFSCAPGLWAQKKGKDDWKSSPLAMHDKLISQADAKRFASWGMITFGVSMTLGGYAKLISPAFKDVPKTNVRMLWLPVTGILTTIAAYPMSRSSKKIRKKAWEVIEQSAYIGNQKQPFARYPAIGLKISL
jgi:hypothetical protein